LIVDCLLLIVDFCSYTRTYACAKKKTTNASRWILNATLLG